MNEQWFFSKFFSKDQKVLLNETKEWFSLYFDWENSSILIWKDKIDFLIQEWKIYDILDDISLNWKKWNASEFIFSEYERLMNEKSNSLEDINEIQEQDSIEQWNENLESIFRIESNNDIDEFFEFIQKENDKNKSYYFYFSKFPKETLSVWSIDWWLLTINQSWNIENILWIIQEKIDKADSQAENIMFYLNEWVSKFINLKPWIMILNHYINWTNLNEWEVNELTRRNLTEFMLYEKNENRKKEIENKANKSIEEMSYDELRKFNYIINEWIDTKNIYEMKNRYNEDIVEIQWMLEEQERVIKEYEDTLDKKEMFSKLNQKIENWEINTNNIEDILNAWSKLVNNQEIERLDDETRQKIIEDQIMEEIKTYSNKNIWDEIYWLSWNNSEDSRWIFEKEREKIDSFWKVRTLFTWWRIDYRKVLDGDLIWWIEDVLRDIIAEINREDTFLDIVEWKELEVNWTLYEIIKEHWFISWRIRKKTNSIDSDVFLEEIYFRWHDWSEVTVDIKEWWITWSKIHWKFKLYWYMTDNFIEIEDTLRLNERTKNMLIKSRKIKKENTKQYQQETRQNNKRTRKNQKQRRYQDSSWYSRQWNYWWIVWRTVWKTISFWYRTTKSTLRWIWNFFFK